MGGIAADLADFVVFHTDNPCTGGPPRPFWSDFGAGVGGAARPMVISDRRKMSGPSPTQGPGCAGPGGEGARDLRRLTAYSTTWTSGRGGGILSGAGE